MLRAITEATCCTFVADWATELGIGDLEQTLASMRAVKGGDRVSAGVFPEAL